jgi:hypothetical protein
MRTCRLRALLDLAFKYGQNDFQPRPFPSLSVGDVIEVSGLLFIVRPFGFAKISRRELRDYRALPRRERSWSSLARP